jgi:hypothetical protein
MTAAALRLDRRGLRLLHLDAVDWYARLFTTCCPCATVAQPSTLPFRIKRMAVRTSLFLAWGYVKIILKPGHKTKNGALPFIGMSFPNS